MTVGLAGSGPGRGALTRGATTGGDAPMLLFRIICAFFVAWAMNWAVNRPEAALLREDFPEFVLFAPLVGAFVGFQSLAKRQGWGGVVAVANGVWTGVFCLGLNLFVYVTVKIVQTPQTGSFDAQQAMRQMGEYAAEVVDALASPVLLAQVVGATVLVSAVTEVIHWAMVHIRRKRGVKERNTRRAHRPSMY